MLIHIGQQDVAERVHNAWLRTMEDGVHTYDVFSEAISKEKVGTKEFAEAVVARLGQKPAKLKPVQYGPAAERKSVIQRAETAQGTKGKLEGIDIFVQWDSRNAESLASALQRAGGDGLKLVMIDNRGVKVWPHGMAETFCTESFRCRFLSEGDVSAQQVIALQGRVIECGVDIAKTESLRSFDGKPGYTLAQGQ